MVMVYFLDHTGDGVSAFVRGIQWIFDNGMMRSINKLRKKRNSVTPDDAPVQSVYSVGYKLVL